MKHILSNIFGLAVFGLIACQQPTKVQTPMNYSSANPYLPVWEFIPDGEPYVFEDPDQPGQYRVYVYGSHDMLVDQYCGRDQVVWSAPVENPGNWRYGGVIFESKLNAVGENLYEDGRGDVLFAPDVAVTVDSTGKKTYWLYPNNQGGGRNSQIARSDRPDGPFTVCNWSEEDPNRTEGVLGFDPAVFVDGDGRVYGYWGFETSNGAELDPQTMASVKPETEVVTDMIPGRYQEGRERFFEASSIRKIKDKYVFIYSRWTLDGEEGLPETNYTLAYCYGDHPLGPWTYGGTIIDARGREKQEDGTTIPTACPGGNTHGSICEINGKWFVFYHRQAGNSEFSRQAMVAPVTVEVEEGPGGKVLISEGEYTSEGFNTDGLDPFNRYPAGIACYYVGPKPAYQNYPFVEYNGPHTSIKRLKEIHPELNPYDVRINRSTMIDIFSGSTIGYKYFNLDKTSGKKDITLHLNYITEGVTGTMDIYVDQPGKGGIKVASVEISATEGEECHAHVNMKALKKMCGKHSLFLTFTSDTPDRSLCELVDFYFTAR